MTADSRRVSRSVLLVVVIVVLVLLATIPIGGGADAKPLINIRF